MTDQPNEPIDALDEILEEARPRTNTERVSQPVAKQLAAVPLEQCPPEIAKALVEVLGKIERVPKSGYNKFQNYPYATESDVTDAIRPALAKAGLFIAQQEGAISFQGANKNVLKVAYTFTYIHASGARWPAWEPFVSTGITNCLTSKGNFDDKSLNKCRTAARKVFLISQFLMSAGDAQDDPDHADGESRRTTDQQQNPPQQRPAPNEADTPFGPSSAPEKTNGKSFDPDELQAQMGIRSLQEALKLASTGIEIDKILIDARTVIEDAKIRWPDTIYPALQAKIAGYRNRVVDNLDDEIPL